MNYNKMAVITWYDSDTVDTVRIAAQTYGVSIKAIEPTGKPNEVEVCIAGMPENVDRLVADNLEGDVEPFDSLAEMSDDEYQEWLSEKLREFDVLYIPNTPIDDNIEAELI